MHDPNLDAYESDASREAGALFLDLVADYLARTRDEAMAVGTRHDAATLAKKFSEPLPRRGRALKEIVAQLARVVVPDSTKLMHPMYMGHQVSAPLPAATWSESLELEVARHRGLAHRRALQRASSPGH